MRGAIDLHVRLFVDTDELTAEVVPGDTPRRSGRDRGSVTVLPQALKEWRRVAQISQATLASRAGVSEGLIAQIETGRRQPGVQNALAIAEVLGVPLDAIAVVNVPLDPTPDGRAA